MTRLTKLRMAVVAACCLVLALAALRAQTPAANKIQRIPIPNSDFPISLGVWVPAGSDTLYLSGNVPPVVNTSAPKGSLEAYGGSTEAQTVATLQRIQQALESQKLTLGDVVMMHVYLVGDPNKDNKMDFAGFMAGYVKYFGTKEQPNKPSRSAFQVAALAATGRASGSRSNRGSPPLGSQRRKTTRTAISARSSCAGQRHPHSGVGSL